MPSILESLQSLLRDNDSLLKGVGVLAAPGGIWFWFDKYRNRIRLRIRNLNFVRGDSSGRGLSFDIENLGSAGTSLEPTFTVTAYSPERTKAQYVFRINGNDRKLPPLEVKSIEGWHSHSESRSIIWGWYMVLTIQLTRGSNVRVRLRNSQLEQLGWLRFHYERLRFKVLHQTPDGK